jgi:hypothetical protein
MVYSFINPMRTPLLACDGDGGRKRYKNEDRKNKEKVWEY